MGAEKKMRLVNFLVSIRRLPPLSDLSGDEERFLFELFELSQRLEQIAVSDTYGLAGGKSSSTAYRMLIGLQDKGLLTLSVDSDDRRRRGVAFTDTARQLFSALA